MSENLRKRNPEQTRRLILHAAITEFADKGYGSARVDNIAQIAGANKRMLYHYFGNKEGLYLAALEETYARIRNAERELDLESVGPLEAIRKLTLFTWDYYEKSPDFIKMLSTENLLKAKYLKRSDHVRTINSPLVPGLAKVITRGQKEGGFRPDMDPFDLYLTIASLCYFYFSNSATLGYAFNRDMLSKKERSGRRAHVLDVILSYVTDKG